MGACFKDIDDSFEYLARIQRLAAAASDTLVDALRIADVFRDERLYRFPEGIGDFPEFHTNTLSFYDTDVNYTKK